MNLVENLQYPAMTEHTEDKHPEIVQLVTGHFQETAGYSSWRERGTADWLLIATLGGGGRFGSDTGEFRTQPGDLTLLRPGTRHDYTSGEHWELLWTHFHPRADWLTWLIWPEEAPGLMRLPLREPVIRQKILARFREMHHLATGALRHRETFAMNALEEVLLWCDTQNPLSEQARLDHRVRDVMDYLVRHLADPLTPAQYGAVSGLSPSRLSHLFRAQVGQTPQQFLEEQRLRRAAQLLELTSRPVAVIAAEVGYENPFYFTLRFKKHSGLSPRDYRKKHGGS